MTIPHQHIEIIATIDPMDTHRSRFGANLESYIHDYGWFFYHVTELALSVKGEFDILNFKKVVAAHYGHDVTDFAEAFEVKIIDGRWCSGVDDPDLDPLLKFSVSLPELELEAYLYEYSFAAWSVNGQWYCPRID
ncbi:hypothetical protein QTV44_002493 [Vibrio vulnificus]|nr:hypothetical protein [Vibrio vulnificus]